MTQLLVVEDSRTQAQLVRSDLEAAGYQVTVATNGAEALGCLRDDANFALVLSDVVMAGMGGYELCQAVKSDPRLARLPVVLLTSLSDPSEVVRALEAGADSFLRKPYDPDRLLERIESTLRQRRQRAEGRGGAGEVFLAGQRYDITAERQRILDLLVSAFRGPRGDEPGSCGPGRSSSSRRTKRWSPPTSRRWRRPG